MEWLIVGFLVRASGTAVNGSLSPGRAFSTNGLFRDTRRFRYAGCAKGLS